MLSPCSTTLHWSSGQPLPATNSVGRMFVDEIIVLPKKRDRKSVIPFEPGLVVSRSKRWCHQDLPSAAFGWILPLLCETEEKIEEKGKKRKREKEKSGKTESGCLAGRSIHSIVRGTVGFAVLDRFRYDWISGFCQHAATTQLSPSVQICRA